MKGLLKYDPKYRIDKDWVEDFRKFLLTDLKLYYQKENEMILRYKGKMWTLTNNGLEFNLTMINVFDHPSEPYVGDGMAVDPEELALRIVRIIKEDYRVSKVTRDAVTAMDKALSDKSTEFIHEFNEKLKQQ